MNNGGTLRTLIGTALLAACPALFTAPAAAAPKTMIVLSSVTYDTGLDDIATALATDAAGNIYVTGTSGNDYVSMKYTKTLVAGTPIA